LSVVLRTRGSCRAALNFRHYEPKNYETYLDLGPFQVRDPRKKHSIAVSQLRSATTFNPCITRPIITVLGTWNTPIRPLNAFWDSKTEHMPLIRPPPTSPTTFFLLSALALRVVSCFVPLNATPSSNPFQPLYSTNPHIFPVPSIVLASVSLRD